jgi:hypothetical protein
MEPFSNPLPSSHFLIICLHYPFLQTPVPPNRIYFC